MSCIPCARDLHEECQTTWDSDGDHCCCDASDKEKALIASTVDSWGIDGPSNGDPVDTEKRPVGRPRKNDDEIGTSAGRKRAAEAYPLYTDKPCEWRWLANCGGGKHPIVGCLDGKQVNRHHGPIKNTAHNEQNNVHLICSPCHNLWHAANDGDYDETANETLPHTPRPMTPAEMLGSR